MSNKEEECRSCKFYLPDSSLAENEGYCRFNAPSPLIAHPSLFFDNKHEPKQLISWPVVMGDLWCGQYQVEKVEIK